MPPDGRGVRRLLLAAALLAASCNAEPPRYVAGPASGLQLECREAGQTVPALSALVREVADLDGDGKPDHLLDVSPGCPALIDLYCTPAGCKLDVYLSSQSGYAGGWKARRWSVDRGARPARLVLIGGEDCAADECSRTIGWTGEALAVLR